LAGCLATLSACAAPGTVRLEPAARSSSDLVYDQNARHIGNLGAPRYQVLDAAGNVVFLPGRYPDLARRVSCVPTAVQHVEASRRSLRAGNGMFWGGLGLMAVGVSGVAAGAALADDGSSVELPLLIGGIVAVMGGTVLSQKGARSWDRAQIRVLDAVNAYNDQRSRTPACQP